MPSVFGHRAAGQTSLVDIGAEPSDSAVWQAHGEAASSKGEKRHTLFFQIQASCDLQNAESPAVLRLTLRHPW